MANRPALTALIFHDEVLYATDDLLNLYSSHLLSCPTERTYFLTTGARLDV